jgi:hypothetical protein
VKNPVVVTLSDEESDPDLGLYSPATSPDILLQVKIHHFISVSVSGFVIICRIRIRIRIPSINKKNNKVNLDFYSFVTSC